MSKRRKMMALIIAIMTVIMCVFVGCGSKEEDFVENIRFMTFTRVDEQGGEWEVHISYMSEDTGKWKANVVGTIGIGYCYPESWSDNEVDEKVETFTSLEGNGIEVSHDSENKRIEVSTEHLSDVDIEELADFLGITTENGVISVDAAKEDWLAQGYETDGESSIGD